MSGTQKPAFTLVDEPPQDATSHAAARLLGIALATLSQRALVGISDLFTLILVGSVCFLAFHTLDNPSREQIVLVFGYAVFCFLIDATRRRAKK